MAPTHSQNTRTSRLGSVLGPQKLVFLEFSGNEAVNELFDFRLRGLATGEPINESDILVTTMTVEASTSGGGAERAFDGVVTGVRYLSAHEQGHVYEFDLKPWLWLLGKSQTSRIFHRKTVPEIIETVFGDWSGFPFVKYELKLQEPYPQLEYTVQYRESDLQFVRRLMEEYGINFHFEMQPDTHRLVLSDHAEAFTRLSGPPKPYLPRGDSHAGSQEHFSDMFAQRGVTLEGVTLQSYDFKRPTTDIEARVAGSGGNDRFQMVDYVGRYIEQQVGRMLARRRADGHRVFESLVQAQGDVLSLGAGNAVGVTLHPLAALNDDFICLSANHQLVGQNYRSGGVQSETYQGSYTLVKRHVPVAPPRITPQAVMHGPQTAVVVGEGEIDCDEYGRILVCFHWDQEQAHSMRCRVQQTSASSLWGALFTPRIGMEVVVEFLDGDPDRPLVTGCVYNARNMPPVGMPANKTMSGIWTNSVGGAGFNSFTFEDKSGSEMITLHGQQDMQARIERDETRDVVNDTTLTVGNNRKTDIGVNDTLDVGDKLKITAGTSIELIVGGSSITIMDGSIVMKSREIEVKGMTSVTVESSAALTTKGLTAEHTATAAMTVKGAIVKIN